MKPHSFEEKPEIVDTRPRVPLWLLALITLSGTLAMHIFVPALPSAARDLSATPSSMQMTVSLYIVGLAVGQLAYGPLADRFGRRPTLLVGLGLYSLAGLAAVFAPNVGSLIGLRLFQALGGCAGLALGRAIVRDIAGPRDAARRLALMNLMVSLGPGLAPLAGGALASTLGWRWIFVFLTLLGFGLMALAWRLLPETGPRAADFDIAALGSNYRGLLVSRKFIGLALGGGCATTAMYAFIASAPFIFVGELHRPSSEIGLYLAILIAGVWLGSALTSRLIAILKLKTVLVGANLLSVFAAAVFLAAGMMGALSLSLTLVSMFLFTLGAGVASPAALTLAISVNQRVTGSAAGLYGCAQMIVGAVCTTAAGIGHDPALASGLVMVAAGLLAQISFVTALKQ